MRSPPTRRSSRQNGTAAAGAKAGDGRRAGLRAYGRQLPSSRAARANGEGHGQRGASSGDRGRWARLGGRGSNSTHHDRPSACAAGPAGASSANGSRAKGHDGATTKVAKQSARGRTAVGTRRATVMRARTGGPGWGGRGAMIDGAAATERRARRHRTATARRTRRSGSRERSASAGARAASQCGEAPRTPRIGGGVRDALPPARGESPLETPLEKTERHVRPTQHQPQHADRGEEAASAPAAHHRRGCSAARWGRPRRPPGARRAINAAIDAATRAASAPASTAPSRRKRPGAGRRRPTIRRRSRARVRPDRKNSA